MDHVPNGTGCPGLIGHPSHGGKAHAGGVAEHFEQQWHRAQALDCRDAAIRSGRVKGWLRTRGRGHGQYPITNTMCHFTHENESRSGTLSRPNIGTSIAPQHSSQRPSLDQTVPWYTSLIMESTQSFGKYWRQSATF